MYLYEVLVISTTFLLSINATGSSSHSALSLDNGNATYPPDFSGTTTSIASQMLGDPVRPDAPLRQTMDMRPGLFLRFDQISLPTSHRPPFDAWDIISIICQLQSFALHQVLLYAHNTPIPNPRGVAVPEFRWTSEATAQMVFKPVIYIDHQPLVFSQDLDFMAKQLVAFVRNYQVRDTRILLVDGNPQEGRRRNRVIGRGSLRRVGGDQTAF